MGSVKLKDLKAYVRYDGSGRVVAGSLVFRKKKPKNGRWVEITKNTCCNPEPPSSTTTSTTHSTSTTSTTQPVSYAGYWDSSVAAGACSHNNGQSFGYTFSTGNIIIPGVTRVFSFGNPYDGGQFINFPELSTAVYQVVGNLVTDIVYQCASPITTTTTTTNGITVIPNAFMVSYWLNPNDACNTTSYGNMIIYSLSPTLTSGAQVYSDIALTTPVALVTVIDTGMMSRFIVMNGSVLEPFSC